MFLKWFYLTKNVARINNTSGSDLQYTELQIFEFMWLQKRKKKPD